MDIRMSNIASPMPQIRAKFTNKLGIPLSGCKVYTYEPNSDIPKTTWLDIDKTAENTNPILLDAAGEADIFLDGLYRIVIKDRFNFVVYDVEKTGISLSMLVRPNGQSVETSLTNIDAELNNKQQQIDEKPSQQYVDEKLDLKAPQETTYTKLEVDSALSAKAPQETTYTKLETDVKFSAYVGGRRGFTTLALAQAGQSTLTANTVVDVTNDPDPVKNGTYQWNGTTLTKSDHDPLTQAKDYTDSSVENVSIKLDDSVDIKINGGDLYYANTLLYKNDGYINATGEFVSSTAGYKTTDFIPISPNKKLTVSVNASASVAAVSFWDENKVFISAVAGNNNPMEVEITPPPNAKFIRSSSNLSATPNAYIYAVFDPLLDDPSLIKTTSLDIEVSANLAKPSLIVDGVYVNGSGGLTTSAGWKYIKIPVEAGKTYTFGNFTIDTSGYYVFHTAVNGQISGSQGNYLNSTLPKTVTAPDGSAYLLIDIARPTNTAEQHAQLTVNEGSTLIDYVEPVDVVTKIAGYKLKGSDAGDSTPVPENVVVQGGNATLADIVADSITTGALIANLPTSSAGLEPGQAYIDTATATIKVVM